MTPTGIIEELQNWRAKHKEIDFIIWTGLATNWHEKFQRKFSPDEAVLYLEKLATEQAQARLKYERAKEYIRNAPPSIQTDVRKKMRERGWIDKKLSDVLFENDSQE